MNIFEKCINAAIFVFLKIFTFVLFHVFYRSRVSGCENVPKDGRIILASNHASFFDPMLIFLLSPRRFRSVAAKWLFKLRWLSWGLYGTGCVSTNGSSKGAVAVLDRGEALLIFPEGKCLPKGSAFCAVHKGVAVLALKTGAPIIPIYVKGTYEAWPAGKLFPRFFRKLEITFGPPIYYEKVDQENIPEDRLHTVVAEVMENIKRLA